MVWPETSLDNTLFWVITSNEALYCERGPSEHTAYSNVISDFEMSLRTVLQCDKNKLDVGAVGAEHEYWKVSE